MFSGLSKLADKPFILGFFLPALVGLAAFICANQDWCLLAQWLESAKKGEKGLGDVVAVLFVIWSVAVTLMGLNDLTFRFFEGYFWPFNSEVFVENQRKRFAKLKSQFENMYQSLSVSTEVVELLRKIENEKALSVDEKKALGSVTKVAVAQEENLRKKLNAFEEGFRRQYIFDSPQLLGTRLGNVVRSFEMYPAETYGISSVAAWPRLLGATSKDYRDLISDARASVDMFLSLILVSLVVGLTALGRIAAQVSFAHSYVLVPRFLVTGFVALTAARLFYVMTIYSSGWWGETYKSAYDLYLGTLANKIGCEAPSEPRARKVFWNMVSEQYRYHDEKDFSKYKKTEIAKATTDSDRPSPPDDDGEKES
jgi:hypothetical protein